MEITSSLDGTKATIALSGKLPVSTSQDLEEAVRSLADEAVDFDIDLTDLTYTSSAGLRVFLATNRIASGKGGAMRLLHPSEEVMEIFEMTGLSDVLEIEG